MSTCLDCGLQDGQHTLSCYGATVTTDFDSHHIEGYAHMAGNGRDGHFSVPLISHVQGNLWQGGCINGVTLPDDFKYVMSLYKWEKYKLGPDTKRYTVKMYDSGDVPPEEDLITIANMVNEFVAEGKTLVHCQAGLNRSGLIAGLSLILQGMPAPDAIELLREKRSPRVLCNEAFEGWLLNYGMRKYYGSDE